MSDVPGIPTHHGAIDPEWMQAALAAGGAEPPELSDLRIEDVGDGVSLMGEILRCRLTWSAAGGTDPPERVIVKLASRDARTRRFSKVMGLHKREYDYYRHIAPEASIRSPGLLYGHYDRRKDDIVLVLEDLSDLVFEDVLAGASAERARSAVRSIAGLHGRYWNRLDRPPLSNRCEGVGTRIRVLAQIGYLRALPQTMKRFGAAFAPETRRLAETLGPRAADYMQDMLDGPGSFAHGDYHLNNVFFDPGGAGDGEAVVIDWQVSGRNNPLLDVALFMSRSLTPEVRREVEREVLEVYWEALRRGGVRDFAFEECWQWYRRAMLFSMMVMVLGAGNLGSSERLDTEGLEEIMRRMTAAVEELDAAEFLPGRRRLLSVARTFSAASALGYGLYRRVRR